MWNIVEKKINFPESQFESFLFSKSKYGSGKLIVLGDISREIKIRKRIIDEIWNEVNEEYFGTESKDLEKRFEHCLQKVNIKVSELVKKYGEDWIKKFNCLIFVVRENEIYISSTKDVKAFLIQNKDIVEILEEDVLKEPNPLKLFENLISGEIQKNESMFLCNENILDYISIDSIRRIVTENSISQAIKKFEEILTKDKINSAFAFCIIKFEEQKAEKRKKEYSIEVKIEKEKKDKIKETEIPSQELIEKKVVDKVGHKINKKRYNVFKKYEIKQVLCRIFSYCKGANLTSKLFFITVLILGFIFIKNMYSAKINERERKVVEQYNVLISDIQLKHNDAEVAIIYKQNQKAIKILNEARNLINKLPENSDTQKSNKRILLKENERISNLALNIKEILNPILLFDIAEINRGEFFVYFRQKTSDIYLLNKSIGKLHKFNIDDQKVNFFLIKDEKVISDVNTIAGIIQNELILITNDNKVVILNLDTNKFRKGKIENLNEKILLASTYQNKLYVLTDKGNIYKYYPTINGFGKKIKWLKENINFGIPKQMFIDGNIWILNNKGEIFKLYKGKQQKFSYKLNKKYIIDFYTDAKLDKLYFIDSKRIYCIDKITGDIKSTYSSEKFNNLMRIFTNLKGKIFILDGTKLYGIAEI